MGSGGCVIRVRLAIEELWFNSTFNTSLFHTIICIVEIKESVPYENHFNMAPRFGYLAIH